MAISTHAVDLSVPFYFAQAAVYEDQLGGPGGVSHLLVANNGATDRWLMLFDALTKPADTATSVYTYRVNSGDQLRIDIRRYFATGLTWAVSSTGDALTYDAAGSMAVGVWCGTGTL